MGKSLLQDAAHHCLGITLLFLKPFWSSVCIPTAEPSICIDNLAGRLPSFTISGASSKMRHSQSCTPHTGWPGPGVAFAADFAPCNNGSGRLLHKFSLVN